MLNKIRDDFSVVEEYDLSNHEVSIQKIRKFAALRQRLTDAVEDGYIYLRTEFLADKEALIKSAFESYKVLNIMSHDFATTEPMAGLLEQVTALSQSDSNALKCRIGNDEYVHCNSVRAIFALSGLSRKSDVDKL